MLVGSGTKTFSPVSFAYVAVNLVLHAFGLIAARK